MKKVIFGVLALIVTVALVIGGYTLITSRNLQKYAVEDGVSCPYSWHELRDGTYRLKIDTTAYPDYSWGVECYPKNNVAVVEESSEPGTVIFSILPLNMGQTYVQVYCEQTDPFTVRGFEIDMQISVLEAQTMVVEKTEHKDYAGVATMGAEGDYPMQWWTDSNGIINLVITGENDGSWEAVDYDPESIGVAGPFYRQGSCGFELQSKRAGTFPLTLYDGGIKAIRLEVTVTEELAASITNFSVDTYTFDRSEEHAALEAVAGRTLTLPPQAVATDYSVKDENGFVDFLLNDKEWSWQIATNSSEEELIGKFAKHASETKTTSVGGVVLTAFRFKEGVIVSWNDSPCVMVLYGEYEVTLEDALDVAGQIMEENHGQ